MLLVNEKQNTTDTYTHKHTHRETKYKHVWIANTHFILTWLHCLCHQSKDTLRRQCWRRIYCCRSNKAIWQNAHNYSFYLYRYTMPNKAKTYHTFIGLIDGVCRMWYGISRCGVTSHFIVHELMFSARNTNVKCLSLRRILLKWFEVNVMWLLHKIPYGTHWHWNGKHKKQFTFLTPKLVYLKKISDFEKQNVGFAIRNSGLNSYEFEVEYHAIGTWIVFVT